MAASYDAAEKALALADIAGREMPPWQMLEVREGMALGADGKWAARDVCVLCSRQNGKNGGLEVVELGWLLNEPGVSVLHTAHEGVTAMEAMDRLVILLGSDPLLEAEVAPRGIKRTNGKEMIKFRNGSVIRFRTRTKSFGRGFSVDRLVIDEAMIYSPAAMAALEPMLTTSDKPGASGPGLQIWYLGSAADVGVHEYCGKWASLRKRALCGGSSRLLWLEWSAPDPPAASTPPTAHDEAVRTAWREDRDTWAWSNPSLGYLLTEQYIAEECESFAENIEKWEVERLGVGRWPFAAGLGGPPIFGDAKWADMAYEIAPDLQGDMAFGAAMSEDMRWITIAAAQRTADGRTHLEIGYHETPTPADADRLVRLILRLDPCCLMLRSKSPILSLLPALVTKGIEPEVVTGPLYAQFCGGLYLDAVNGLLSHSDDPRLNTAVEGAQADEPGGVPQPRPGAVIVAFEAAILAWGGLVTFGSAAPAQQAPAGDENYQGEDEFDIFAAAF